MALGGNYWWMKWGGFGKWASLIKVLSGQSSEGAEKIMKHMPGQPVLRPKFEASASRIQALSVTSTPTCKAGSAVSVCCFASWTAYPGRVTSSVVAFCSIQFLNKSGENSRAVWHFHTILVIEGTHVWIAYAFGISLTRFCLKERIIVLFVKTFLSKDP
jgi:hypothetical protein